MAKTVALSIELREEIDRVKNCRSHIHKFGTGGQCLGGVDPYRVLLTPRLRRGV